MKTRKIANYLKIGILLLGISLLLWNCEKINVLETQIDNQSEFKIKEKTFNGFLPKTKFIKAIEELKKLEYKSKTKNSLYNFTVDSTKVREIKEKNITSYTFFVKREKLRMNYFENLVLQIDSLNNIKALLFQYFPEGNNLSSKSYNPKNFKGNVKIFPLNLSKINFLSKVDVCQEVSITYCTAEGMDGGKWYNDFHVAEANCYKHNSLVTVTKDVCYTFELGGGGISYWDDGDNDGYVNNDEPNGGGTGLGNPVTTSPISYACNDSVHGCGKVVDMIARQLQLNSDESNWLRNQPEAIILFYEGYLEINLSAEAEVFAKYSIEVMMANSNANPLLGSDCRSFEFARPPGALQKACAVKDFRHTFYSAGVTQGGGIVVSEIDSNFPLIYFTMPSWMSNGQAANNTAKAITRAVKATDLYYANNPKVSKFVLGDKFIEYIQFSLKLYGGKMTQKAPFNIPSPAPYITSLLGAKTDCN